MSLAKWFSVVGVIAAGSLSSPVLAKESITLNCPAGTVQSSRIPDIVACVKTRENGSKIHGPTVYLYPNGAKQSEGMTEDGFRTGLWTFYSEQGRKTGSASFKHSSFHGDVVELHENGKVKKVEQYVDGLREGTVKEFSEDGTLVKQATFHSNREVAVK